jgi:hypothetical protein
MQACGYRAVVDGARSDDSGRASKGMSLSREKGTTVLVGMCDQDEGRGLRFALRGFRDERSPHHEVSR